MPGDLDNAVVGVDGGGTRCRLCLCWGDGDRRVTIEGGPANVSSNFDQSIAEIVSGYKALSEASNVSYDALLALPAYLGLAGVTGDAMARRVGDALPLDRVRIEDDRPAALAGALGVADGALAHCGTGSFWAVQSGGNLRLAGGWGARLGDEASAHWVARMALSATLRASDGRSNPSGLTRALIQKFGPPEDIVALAATASPERIGRIAPLVTAAAQDGDETARAIMMAGAQDIAASLRAMGWAAGMPLCLTGGIGAAFAGFLPDVMRDALISPRGAPIDGAVMLARAFAREERR